jgi:type II secretory pathway pseudopilin PulG
MIRNQYRGLGDLYEPAKASAFEQEMAASQGWQKWESLAFGVAPMPAQRQGAWSGNIAEAYQKLRDAGQLSSEDYAWAVQAAGLGILLTPASGLFASDPDAFKAWQAVYRASGLAALKRDLLAELTLDAQAENAALAADLSVLDAACGAMYYVSGTVALDKLNATWEAIKAQVEISRSILASAEDLDEEAYVRVNEALNPINAQLDRLTAYFASDDLGRVGTVQLAVVAIVGVVLVVAALVLAFVVKTNNYARNVYAQEAARINEARLAAAKDAYDSERESNQAALDAGQITPEEKAARDLAAADRQSGEVNSARKDLAESALKLPETSTGGLGTTLTVVALAGIGAWMLLRKQ